MTPNRPALSPSRQVVPRNRQAVPPCGKPPIGTPVVRHLTIDGFGYRVRVAGSGPTLVLLHGFTGSSDVWLPFFSELSTRWRIVAPDLPGHGGSDAPHSPATWSLERCARDLSAMLKRLGATDAVVLGYSMGGRVALTWAAADPGRVRALILESASPGIKSASERARRREEDENLAQFIEANGVERFVDRWEQVPLFASQRRLPEHVRQNVRRRRVANSAHGLAASLRTMGAGRMNPLHDRLSRLNIPVLLLAGALDEKYGKLTGKMVARLPKGRLDIVSGAGHAIHVEKPDEWLQRVNGFLESVRPDVLTRCAGRDVAAGATRSLVEEEPK